MIDDIDISSSTLRLLASQELKRWDNKAVFRLLSDKDPAVRTLAGRELQVRGGKEIFDYVRALSDSNVVDEREICAFVLGQFGTPNYPFKEASLPLLLGLVVDDSPEVRAAAAAGLGHLCYSDMPPDVEEALFLAASDNSELVRSCVAVSLGNARRKNEALAILNGLLKDDDAEVRGYAQTGVEILTGSEPSI